MFRFIEHIRRFTSRDCIALRSIAYGPHIAIYMVMTNTERVMVPYILPDGRTVMVDDSAAKGANEIGFTLKGGQIVQAVRVINDETVAAAMYGNRCRVAIEFYIATGNPAEADYAYLNARWAGRLGCAAIARQG